MASMEGDRSRISVRRKLIAAACFVVAIATVVSLNSLLPLGTSYRFEIGWTLILIAGAMVVVGLAALFGDRVASIATVKWDSWSVRKRITVCIVTYLVGGVLAHAGVHLYDATRQSLRENLSPNISWWFQ